MSQKQLKSISAHRISSLSRNAASRLEAVKTVISKLPESRLIRPKSYTKIKEARREKKEESNKIFHRFEEPKCYQTEKLSLADELREREKNIID